MTDTHDETQPREVWSCGECGFTYQDEDDARECCEPPPPLEGWQCRQCDEVHAVQDDAQLCCYDEDGEPLPPSAAELEARGQMRLPAMA